MNVLNSLLAWAKKNLIIVIIVGVLLGGFLVWYGTKQSVLSEGNKQEARLSAMYNDGANYLSNCVIKTHQAVDVAQANAEAFDKVIKDAIAGSGSAEHVDLGTTAGRNAFLPILVQAYPDLKGQTDLFNKVVDIIVECQGDFRKQQTQILDAHREFKSWMTGSWKVRTFGGQFPNDNLEVNLPGVQYLSGKAAMRKIGQPIVDAQTSTSYQNGQQPDEDLFGESDK